ncbi:MAG TPA: hypothetical protein VKE98_03770, partial [Gemmataceae bacterium]|nr:hypothetical protein [Gemmataceae bacterium]
MRKGFLGTMALLIGTTVAHAQQWPTYGYQQSPGYGYPQYSGYGYQYQYPGYYQGYYPRPSGNYYPNYQQNYQPQWTPQQVQVNSALVYPRAGYASPAVQQQAIPSQSTSYNSPPLPRVVTLPQAVNQNVPEPLPVGP